MLTHEQTAASLFAHWDAAFPLATTTVYPGATVDSAALDEWVEIALDSWTRRPQRSSNNIVAGFSVTVHCFVQPGTDKSRVYELADAARTALSQQTFLIRDHQASGSPTVGWARTFEVDVRDLTRTDADQSRHRLAHAVATVRGVASEA